MNLVIHEDKAVEDALEILAQRLEQLFGKPDGEIKWTFPNGGGPDTLPTWSVPLTNNEYLILGLTPEFRWHSGDPERKRCPFLLRIDERPAQDGITPNVEVNIPQPMRRTVNGCFAMNSTDGLWLFHRGSKLTVHSNQKIPKEDIHQHFRNVCVSARDNEVINDFIPVVRLESNKDKFKADLASFVKSVDELKSTWAD